MCIRPRSENFSDAHLKTFEKIGQYAKTLDLSRFLICANSLDECWQMVPKCHQYLLESNQSIEREGPQREAMERIFSEKKISFNPFDFACFVFEHKFPLLWLEDPSIDGDGLKEGKKNAFIEWVNNFQGTTEEDRIQYFLQTVTPDKPYRSLGHISFTHVEQLIDIAGKNKRCKEIVLPLEAGDYEMFEQQLQKYRFRKDQNSSRIFVR